MSQQNNANPEYEGSEAKNSQCLLLLLEGNGHPIVSSIFFLPSILSVHWTLVICSEFFVQSSFSISVLGLPKSWINYLITWNFRDMLFRDFDVRLFRDTSISRFCENIIF